MASDQEKAGSVFDILYADVRRLSSFLSQLSEDGVVTELVRGAEEAASTQAGVSIKVLKADATESGKTTTSRKIDPQWQIPLLFLDKAKDIIQRDITEASIGSLVLGSGPIDVSVAI